MTDTQTPEQDPLTIDDLDAQADKDFVEVDVLTDPFEDAEGYTKSFDDVGDIRFSTFQDEIEAALRFDVRLALRDGSLFVNADQEFDGRKVRGLITSHDAEAAPQVDEDLQKALDALDESALDLEAVTVLLRHLINR